MNLTRLRATLVAISCCGATIAQTSWIVDAMNGPGTNFTSLSVAVGSVDPGDVLLVRAGDYAVNGLIVDKPLAILGIEPGVALNAAGGLITTGAIQVSNVGPGEAFVLRNVQLGGSLFGPDLAATGCSGALLIDHVEGTIGSLFIPEGPRLSFEGCDQVHVNGAFVRGGGNLSFVASTVALTRTIVEGELVSGVGATDCELTIDGCTIVKDSAPLQFGAALSVNGGRARIVRSEIRAGNSIGTQLPAIAATNMAVLEIDPTTTLIPASGQPPIGGSASIFNDEFVSLARGANPNVPTLELLGKISSVHATFVSLPFTTTATPFGTLWLDPSPDAYLLLDLGVFQTRTHTLALPNLPLPTGATFALQTVFLDQAVTFGNGLLYVVP